jgi:hypothetical protein
MSLSQVQIIRSLGEALAWFEKELSWNVAPAELRHLTGRIGELYAAMITRGQMALSVNQHGYDVVSAEGDRISVKTITSSSHVAFSKSTLHQASHVMILRVNVAEGEASIEELFRGSVGQLTPLCNDAGPNLSYPIKKPACEPVALDGLAITGSAQIDRWRIIQFENGSIAVDTDGVREPVVKPVLREIARRFGINPLNGAGNPMNTRQLGAAIIASMASGSAGKFAWNDGDVDWLDDAGNVLTHDQVMEMQAEARRRESEG